eukprot:363203-Chlamydomonas_euryale.AAC.34
MAVCNPSMLFQIHGQDNGLQTIMNGSTANSTRQRALQGPRTLDQLGKKALLFKQPGLPPQARGIILDQLSTSAG